MAKSAALAPVTATPREVSDLFPILVSFTLAGALGWPTGWCQGKVEMSASWQSRNVRFGLGHAEVHGKLIVPVKRRGALVATNPSRNSRSELIGRWDDAILPARCRAWIGVAVGRQSL
jgi:hypothetical protein